MVKKKKTAAEEPIEGVENLLSKTEHYIEENQKSLTIIVAAIIIVVLGYLGYRNLYVAPMEEEARSQMFMAERYFERDSFNLALYGDGNFLGFIDIIDEYSVTKSANLSHYYSGISFLRTGEYEDAIEYLTRNPDVSHGDIKIAFTPDEEIGKGADHFDVKKFGADFAYTVDGGEVGELQYENFNAAHASVRISGRNIHPGDAKNKMINATLLGMEYNRMLPDNERPEHTETYEGFYHLLSFKGNVETATMEYIIRDHDNQHFEQRKSKMRRIAARLNEKYGEGCFSIEIKDQYYNMRNKLSPVMEIVDLAQEAMKELKITPLIRPIRGGTDGARLSYMGLPCPNLFAGGHNFHGRYEFVPLESIERATEVILAIIKKAAEPKK